MKYFLAVCLLVLSIINPSNAQDKNFIGGLKGTDSLSVSRVTWASMIVPGYGQAYNRQYWKIPTLYLGAGAFIYGGIHSNNRYQETGLGKYRTQRNLYYTGAGLLYLGSVIDAVYNYKVPAGRVVPEKASFYSALVPGLGQAYNGEYWKIPVIYAGFSFLGYWYDLNAMQYRRYRTAYNASTDNDPNTISEFGDRISPDGIKRYRDRYRRDRDYAVLYMGLFYVLNIIDANVFAHLSNFDVSDDLALNFSPSITPSDNLFASGLSNSTPTVGMTLKLTFKDKKKKW